MSECLVENIDRLKETSLIRERMYGEYECALLLQKYMLQKVMEDFKHPHFRVRLISKSFVQSPKGLLIKIDEKAGEVSLILVEAQEAGFNSLFELNHKVFFPLEELQEGHVCCIFSDNNSCMHYQAHRLPKPLVWSTQSNTFMEPVSQTFVLPNQTMIFLYNSGLVELLGTEEKVAAWFAKVLRHFAQDGLETIQTMLNNELNFLCQKQEGKANCHIISLQINQIPINPP